MVVVKAGRCCGIVVAEADEWWSSRLDVAEDICIVFVLYLLNLI